MKSDIDKRIERQSILKTPLYFKMYGKNQPFYKGEWRFLDFSL